MAQGSLESSGPSPAQGRANSTAWGLIQLNWGSLQGWGCCQHLVGLCPQAVPPSGEHFFPLKLHQNFPCCSLCLLPHLLLLCRVGMLCMVAPNRCLVAQGYSIPGWDFAGWRCCRVVQPCTRYLAAPRAPAEGQGSFQHPTGKSPHAPLGPPLGQTPQPC